MRNFFSFITVFLITLFVWQIAAAKSEANPNKDWTVILLSSFLMEEDFLFQEILPIQELAITKYQVPANTTLCDLAKLKPSNIIPGRVIIIGIKECNQDPRHVELRKSLKYFSPKLYIEHGDEGGYRQTFNFIGNYTTLYCRQYCHGSESTTRTSNTLYIGLGYSQDTISSRIVHNNAPQEALTTNEYRQYVWSFLGQKDRGDIKAMLDAFKNLAPNYDAEAVESKIPQIYKQTWFVPVSRGDNNLDCFRIYEAAAMGAIPVIVGDFHEIEKTFGCYKNVLLHTGIQFMPAVFADTWSQAIHKMKKILNNREELISRSIKIKAWFISTVLYTRNCIAIALGVSEGRTDSRCLELIL